MRFIPLAALMLAMSLTGCDRNHKTEAVANQPCNCLPQPPKAAQAAPAANVVAAVRHHRPHRRYAHARFDEHAYAREWPGAENLQAEESTSRSYYVGQTETRAEARSWTDGYGRVHFYAGGGETHLARAEEKKRLAPWHGYDVDCPEK